MRESSRLLLSVAVLTATFVSAPVDAGSIFRDWAEEEIDTVKERTLTAKNRAVEISNRVRDGFNELTQQIRDRVDEGVEDLKREIQEEIDGREEFLGGDCPSGSPCGQFRQDIIDLLDNMQELANTMFEIAESDVDISFDKLTELIEAVPGRALFPLYRALQLNANLFDSSFVQQLDSLVVCLNELYSTLGTCEEILDEADTFQECAFSVTKISGGMKLVGKALSARGATTAEPDAGIHGYVHLTVKNNRKKKLGTFLDGMADVGLAFSAYAHNKLRYCTILRGHEEILAIQQQLVAGQQEILEAIESVGPPWGRAKGHER